MRQLITLLFVLCICFACSSLKKQAECYRVFKDAYCLQLLVDQVKIGTDTADIRKLLGEPINFGFDFRYLVDQQGENGCSMGAVFHIDDNGKIDDKWYGEICE